MNLVIVAWVLARSIPHHAETTSHLCPDSTTFFEFQVVAADGDPAHWIVDTSLAVHPTSRSQNPLNLVQFVVDTAGTPVARTFHAIKITDTAIVNEARRSINEWRFTPAVRDGCKVRQLIQTPIGR